MYVIYGLLTNIIVISSFTFQDFDYCTISHSRGTTCLRRVHINCFFPISLAILLSQKSSMTHLSLQDEVKSGYQNPIQNMLVFQVFKFDHHCSDASPKYEFQKNFVVQDLMMHVSELISFVLIKRLASRYTSASSVFFLRL